MRHTLNALTNELKRLSSTGVRTVAVSPDNLSRLQSAVAELAQTQCPEPEPEAMPKVAKSDPPTVKSLASNTQEAILPSPPKISLPQGNKATRWNALREIVLTDPVCQRLVRPEMKVVFGVGSIDANIMFVGEAPGAEEEKQGEPFVGPAGQLLTKMIGAMGLSRDSVYIGNIMNWRPQMVLNEKGEQFGNRPPTKEEMDYCLPFLREQIEVVDPQLIVALGSTAAHGLLGKKAFGALGEVRGKWHEFAGKPLMVTYHPSYILRNQSNRSKRLIWEDLLQVMQRCELPITPKQQKYFLGR